jgi:hypothetical protein
MTESIGNRHTGHTSPRAFNIRAQIKQHAICPVSPCIIVAVRSSHKQITHRESWLLWWLSLLLLLWLPFRLGSGDPEYAYLI